MRRTGKVLAPLAAALLLVPGATWAPAAGRGAPPSFVKGVKVLRDVEYGRAGGERLLLDLYIPEGAKKPLPAVVLIHGGGWVGGDKSRTQPAALFIAGHGYIVASVNYRLAPRHKYPAQLDDVQRAVRWLRMHAKDFGIDPKRIAAWGSSAGGHLAARLGLRDARDNSDPELSKYSARVQCVVDLFGPTDLAGAAERSPRAERILLAFLGRPYGEAPELWRDASPLYHVSPDDAPFYIIHGTEDRLVPVSESEKLAEALRKAGVEVTFVKIEGMGHGRPLTPRAREAFRRALEGAIRFLDRHLKGKR